MQDVHGAAGGGCNTLTRDTLPMPRAPRASTICARSRTRRARQIASRIFRRSADDEDSLNGRTLRRARQRRLLERGTV